MTTVLDLADQVIDAEKDLARYKQMSALGSSITESHVSEKRNHVLRQQREFCSAMNEKSNVALLADIAIRIREHENECLRQARTNGADWRSIARALGAANGLALAAGLIENVARIYGECHKHYEQVGK